MLKRRFAAAKIHCLHDCCRLSFRLFGSAPISAPIRKELALQANNILELAWKTKVWHFSKPTVCKSTRTPAQLQSSQCQPIAGTKEFETYLSIRKYSHSLHRLASANLSEESQLSLTTNAGLQWQVLQSVALEFHRAPSDWTSTSQDLAPILVLDFSSERKC